MKIAVQGKVIETKAITEIYEVEKYKKQFRNREAGFVIQLVSGSITFSEEIPYETTQGRISDIKHTWCKRMESVIKLWEQDKHDYPTVGW